ncbi:hypothetical protein C8A01DRAFT_38646 [Parachaetomium inaequale]|uniref:Uncharacterized protein n=1 Tax=Parachaetomium inaequale TaxID=2588326 RepID=A0AAN6PCD6_9PEZI|nr:hypothetical protein C8A01DRAFT_38646 [Parachaetomium inaequale]
MAAQTDGCLRLLHHRALSGTPPRSRRLALVVPEARPSAAATWIFLLSATQFTQPALTLMKKASFETQWQRNSSRVTFAGQSLGESSALAAVADITDQVTGGGNDRGYHSLRDNLKGIRQAVDAKTGEPVDEAKYEKYILEHSGIPVIDPELLDGYEPNKKQELATWGLTIANFAAVLFHGAPGRGQEQDRAVGHQQAACPLVNFPKAALLFFGRALGSFNKQDREDDEEYVNSAQTRGLDEHGVYEVMATLMQCKEKWIAVNINSVQTRALDMDSFNNVMATLMQRKEKWIIVKLLSRLQATEDEHLRHSLTKFFEDCNLEFRTGGSSKTGSRTPFSARLGNLSYDAAVTEFFEDCNPGSHKHFLASSTDVADNKISSVNEGSILIQLLGISALIRMILRGP